MILKLSIRTDVQLLILPIMKHRTPPKIKCNSMQAGNLANSTARHRSLMKHGKQLLPAHGGHPLHLQCEVPMTHALQLIPLLDALLVHDFLQ